MGLVSETVAGLGTPSEDGTVGLIRTASGHEVELYWNATQGAWLSKPRVAMRQKANVGMRTDGAAATWKYPLGVESPDPGVNSVQFGFQIHKALGFGDLWAAGLRLQEHLSAEMFTSGGSSAPEIALNWYYLNEGDAFLTPVPTNQGVHLVGDNDPFVYHFFSTGWQNSPIAAPAAGTHGYPEIYTFGTAVSFRNFAARYRWVAGDVGAEGSAEQAAKLPAVGNLLGWYAADNIPVVDGGAVAEWADYSGRGQAFQQATGAKRPSVQSAGGIRYVSFDGVDDCLKTIGEIVSGNPFTIFLVLRQNAGGATQQVWLGQKGAGAPLFYRGDATDQVNAWVGGTDLIYHRASPWPSPFMVWTAVCNGATTTLYEGGTQVASGDAGSVGLPGLTLGSNGSETLPAQIDVAEVILAFKAATTQERTDVVAYLQTKYGL